MLPIVASFLALDLDLGTPARMIEAAWTTQAVVGVAVALPSAPGFFGIFPAACRLALVGFSQGTMMSLFTAPRRAQPCAGIMAYSGRLEGGAELSTEIRSRPPVMMVHGDQDELLPVASMTEAAARLSDNGIEVETHVRPGLGHGIDEAGLQIGMSFLAQALAAD